MKNFITEDFLLQTETAKRLYHEHAVKAPIFDYHCHLPVKQIADDIQFENITAAWLYGDHYKWRAMRTNGIAEKYCTGDASDWEKFQTWAQTVPYCLGNPLYHWTHLELKRYFGVEKLLNPDSAKQIYETCNGLLNSPQFSTRNIMRKMNVKCVCTTDDPTDSLEHHIKIQKDGFKIKVLPTWRPDKAMAVENPQLFNEWVDKLSAVADIDIKDMASFSDALQKRHDFFHQTGCRISDHGLETAYAEYGTKQETEKIFNKVRTGSQLNSEEIIKFKSILMVEFGSMDRQKGWTQQLHLGALRNNNSRFFNKIGPDTGFDSIGDFEIAKPLARFLDTLDRTNHLPKTIIYNLNPRDNELIATMIGNFQDGSVPGKIQFGSGWWFLDQKDGMEKQMTALANLGLLGRFVGMLTDSRSFLSYPRHEYFRRILCNFIGENVEKGLWPNDIELLGQMVENISYNNALDYFKVQA